MMISVYWLYSAVFLMGIIVGHLYFLLQTAEREAQINKKHYKYVLRFVNELLPKYDREQLRSASLAQNKFDLECELTQTKNNLDATAAQARRVDRRALVRQWVRAMGRHTLMRGREGVWNVRFKAIEAEFKELRTAMNSGSKRDYLDALGDILYACEVTAFLLDVDGNELFRRIHSSNMTKDKFLFLKDGHGKGFAYKKPDLEDLIPGKRK